MFPGAGARIDYNEAGEVLGWDNDYGYEPEYNPDDYLGGYGDEPDLLDPDTCPHHSINNIDEHEDGSESGACIDCDSEVKRLGPYNAWYLA